MRKFSVSVNKSRGSLLDFFEFFDVCLLVPNAAGVF